MSQRTAEASSAIRKAWKDEQQRVREGKGTRDWTPQQQRDILEKGKAYDDNGKAFEGHHMKSVEAYPQYQGDADDIEFLSRDEHKQAHGNDFHNSTNGYYDPQTHETKDFGDNAPTPPETNKLSQPVGQENANADEDTDDVRGRVEEEEEDEEGLSM